MHCTILIREYVLNNIVFNCYCLHSSFSYQSQKDNLFNCLDPSTWIFLVISILALGATFLVLGRCLVCKNRSINTFVTKKILSWPFLYVCRAAIMGSLIS